MPTRVVDLELNGRPAGLDGLGAYPRALLLLRWNGVPVGQVSLPVAGGRIPPGELEAGLARGLGRDFWFAWLRDSLDLAAAPHDTRPRATVAVCTRERPADLERTLGAIARLNPCAAEVLVVDNRPATAATADVVRRHAGVRYVRQDRGGLDAARNRALAEASHEVVAFTDDDASPDPGWLGAIVSGFADPTTMCVTGLTMPVELETDAQEAFQAYSPFGRGFARRAFDGRSQNPVASGHVGAGANMALRRTVVRDVGQFDEALDAGTLTRSGGDHEFFARIMSAGYRIVYEPAALSWHRHRRTWTEFQEAVGGYGTGLYAMWTRMLVVEREWTTLKLALSWFLHGQLPWLWRAVARRPGRLPVRLLIAEYRGCLRGPVSYFQSRRQAGSSGDGQPSPTSRAAVPAP
jgi:GT2 family glycosyltransferase